MPSKGHMQNDQVTLDQRTDQVMPCASKLTNEGGILLLI